MIFYRHYFINAEKLYNYYKGEITAMRKFTGSLLIVYLIFFTAAVYDYSVGDSAISQAVNDNPGSFKYERDFPTDSLADLICQDSLYSYDTRLEAFYTRHIQSDSIDAARDWIYNKFLEFGYTDVHIQSFLANSEGWGIENEPCFNVYCVKQGTVYPDRYIIIGGHYDSYNTDTDPTVYAPGADDNASGTAVVMEMARILKDYQSQNSMMFVAFSAEEQHALGSAYFAEQLYEDSTDVEFMLNLDMIGYTNDTIPDVHLYSDGTTDSYWNLFYDAGVRVADLIADDDPWSKTDDEPFYEYGWNTLFYLEGDFNWDGWHSDLDLSSRMDFDYLEKVARTSVAGIGIVDVSPPPIGCEVFDIGDGQSLRVVWNDCDSAYTYKVVYDVISSIFRDTVDVSQYDCYIDIQGLTEFDEYYFGVLRTAPSGLQSLTFIISSGSPHLFPRVPENFTAEPGLNMVVLNWQANIELDFSHYKILRTLDGIGYNWEVLEDNYKDTFYVDSDVAAQNEYFYKLLAYDYDMNESDSTDMVRAFPATLDGGVLLVDETIPCGDIPGEALQIAFFYNVFDTAFTTVKIDSTSDALRRSVAGQYNPVFWIDDDNCVQALISSVDTLDWFLGFETDFFLAGWRTIYDLTGTRYFFSGNFYYDKLGLHYINECPLQDFIGATGQEGWPDLEVRPDAPNSGRMEDISIFEAAPGAEAIYRFISNTSHQYFDNKPVGIAYDTHYGKRVVLGFPLYFLTESSAQALIAKTFEYFAEESVLYGDVNGDWITNIFDITYITSYLYLDGPPPIIMNNGDINGDCTINIFDVTYYISYLYLDGPEPVEGCVE